MTIEYFVSEQDYLNFNLYHVDHLKHAKNSKLILRYGVPILYLIAFLILAKGALLALMVGGVIVIGWIVIFPKCYSNSVRRSVKKIICEGKSNDFIGNQKLILKDDCMEEISPDSTSITKYSAVEKIGYGYGCIYVYIGAIKAFVIPVTAFADDKQRDEFINILKEKTGVEPTDVL